jgi:hypothetical protein
VLVSAERDLPAGSEPVDGTESDFRARRSVRRGSTTRSPISPVTTTAALAFGCAIRTSMQR